MHLRQFSLHTGRGYNVVTTSKRSPLPSEPFKERLDAEANQLVRGHQTLEPGGEFPALDRMAEP